jgi:ABC-type sulfate/molybdate transport systems ATPase subunit
MPHPRSPETFLPIRDYPFTAWLRKRKQARKTIAEVAVTHSVPDISEITLEVAVWSGGAVVQRLFPA